MNFLDNFGDLFLFYLPKNKFLKIAFTKYKKNSAVTVAKQVKTLQSVWGGPVFFLEKLDPADSKPITLFWPADSQNQGYQAANNLGHLNPILQK